jgi:aryl-alcohol dehydrogenase-like predicted oxidoreductase
MTSYVTDCVFASEWFMATLVLEQRRLSIGQSLLFHICWDNNQSLNLRVEELSRKKGITMAQVSIAWELSKDGVTAPIVGTTHLKNLQEIVGMYCVALSVAFDTQLWFRCCRR